jgi:hypothetical protein
MTNYPHVQAAFINALREEGTFDELAEALQRQWNECCHLHNENMKLLKRLKALEDEK